jgi:hypothetical protein
MGGLAQTFLVIFRPLSGMSRIIVCFGVIHRWSLSGILQRRCFKSMNNESSVGFLSKVLDHFMGSNIGHGHVPFLLTAQGGWLVTRE